MTAHDDLVSDHAAIVQLTIDYCWALDTAQWHELRDVFTSYAETDLGAGGQSGIGQIIERVSSALQPLDDSQHMVTNHQISIDDDGAGASGRCYLHAQHIRRDAVGGPLYTVGGRYEDRYVRTEDGWRISERRIVSMWTQGNRRVFEHGPE